MDLLTTSVTTVESGSEPYTLVELVGEADVTNSDALREVLDAEVASRMFPPSAARCTTGGRRTGRT